MAGRHWGRFSKFEALIGLAAYLFAQQGVEFGVFEVGLGGRYDATNAWDSELAVLTAIGLDHVDLLGNTLEEIAADKLHIARSGRALVTTAAQPPEVMAPNPADLCNAGSGVAGCWNGVGSRPANGSSGDLRGKCAAGSQGGAVACPRLRRQGRASDRDGPSLAGPL